jgi:hypothetical protein
MHFAILSARCQGNTPRHCANNRIIRKTLN